MYYYPCSRSRSFGPIGVPKHELGNEKEKVGCVLRTNNGAQDGPSEAYKKAGRADHHARLQPVKWCVRRTLRKLLVIHHTKRLIL